MYQGLFGKSIAYNEHGIAPRDSALGRRPGADDERKRNARAAKLERRNRKPYAGPAQPPRTPRRERTVLRALRREVLLAMKSGNKERFAVIAHKFETLMHARALRLQADGIDVSGDDK
jgi:hypothetical protein